MNLELIKQKKSSNIINNILLINTNNVNNINRSSIDNLNLNESPLIRHYPPSTKEWNNSIYVFNKNNMKLLPSVNSSIYSLLKAYFNLNPLERYRNSLYNKRIVSKFLRIRLRKLSIIKVFISKPEIKHSNNKINITIYTYNKKNTYYINKIKKIFNIYNKLNRFKKKIITRFSKLKKEKIKKKKKLFKKNLQNKPISKLSIHLKRLDINKQNKSWFIRKRINLNTNLKRFNNIHSIFIKPRPNITKNEILIINKIRIKLEWIYSFYRKHLEFYLMNIVKIKNICLFMLNYNVQSINRIVSLDKKYYNLFSYILVNNYYKYTTILRLKYFYLIRKYNNCFSSTCLKKNFFKSQYYLNNVIYPYLNINSYETISIRKLRELKKEFLYKYFCSLYYFNNYLFNTKNLLTLKDVLKKIYHKKVELNIINLKYLYLDSNILAEAITRKVKDRKKRVLRILKLGLKLIKKPHFKIHFHKEIIKLNYNFKDKNLGLASIKINSLKHDIAKNKYLVYKPNRYKIRLFIYNMKQKIINGIKLQGTGRITKRLTASRSISKVKYMGSLQNINSSYESISTAMLKGFVKSNLQYTNINSYSRNGSFGIKVSVSVY